MNILRRKRKKESLTAKVARKYEEVYQIASIYALRGRSFREDLKNQKEFRDAILNLHDYYKKALPIVATTEDIGDGDRKNTLLNMVDNNNIVMQRWAKTLGIALDKLEYPSP